MTTDNWLAGQQVRAQFSYDRLGRLVGTTDAVGNAWSWVFDSLGRNTEKSDPDAGIWTFGYDDAGRLKWQVDAKSQRIDLTYAAGRLVSKAPVGVPAERVTMEYGEARPGFFNVGRLTSVTNAAAVQKTDYDALGRSVKQVQTLGGVDYTLERRYDAGGFLRGITYPDGDAIGTALNPLVYDQAGRLTSIPGIVTEVLYDAAGRPTRQQNLNGTLTERGYSVRGFLTGIRTVGSSLIQDLTYESDEAGLLEQVTSSFQNESWNYDYDDLHRLTSATNKANPVESQTFTLDVLGRITNNSRVGSYTYGPSRPHAPSAVAGNPYSYDLNGNLTSGGGRLPQWNVYNLPTEISGAQFLYDGLGERVKKTSAQGTSLYPFGDDYEVTNGVVTKYVSLAGLGVVAKRVGAVALNFPAGSLHAQSSGQATARISRSAATLPENVREILVTNIDRKSELHTDESQLYPAVGREFADHKTVCHGNVSVGFQYVGKDGQTTNHVENFFGTFKRGMVGVYHKCEPQHLQRYVTEFEFRYNNRSKLGITDTMRAETALKGIGGKRLTYRRIGEA